MHTIGSDIDIDIDIDIGIGSDIGIGIGIGKTRLHAAWLRDPEQERSRPKAADNTPDGHCQLLARAERHTRCPPEQLCVIIEATGVGPKLSAWFPALFGAKRFASAKQAAAFLGFVPVEYDSGTRVHRRPRLSKAGDGGWRARLYMPALVAIRFNSAIRAQFTRLSGAGKSKMSAFGAAMRKLVQIAFGVFNSRRPFDVARTPPHMT